MHKLNDRGLWKRKKVVEDNNVKRFSKLTTVEDMELDIYGDALDYAFRESDIHNIAITGYYSSRKSSIIRSYEKSKGFNVAYIAKHRGMTKEELQVV